MIWAGEIGSVTEVHAWTNRPIWPQGLEAMPPESAVPATLNWDSWLGISGMRPYSPEYLPFNWRGWFDFGCGALGDMACHILGAPNMALLLGAPTSVECIKQEGKSPYTYPKKSIIRFDFPARGSMPPVQVFWYDGMTGPPPRPQGLAEEELLGDLPRRAMRPGAAKPDNQAPPPPAARQNRPAQSSNGSLFVGDKGFITSGTYGEFTRLVPAGRMKDYKFPPQFLTRSPGHYRDWIRACKGGDPACSNFAVAGPFTEWILLGVLALRFEGKLEWDSARMKVTNNPEPNKYIKPKFRKGWQFA
jgi:predicted dehydrogenase